MDTDKYKLEEQYINHQQKHSMLTIKPKYSLLQNKSPQDKTNSRIKQQQNMSEDKKLNSEKVSYIESPIQFERISRQVEQIESVLPQNIPKNSKINDKKQSPEKLKVKIQKKSIEQYIKDETEEYLENLALYRPPVKEESKFIKFFRNQNPCHDTNNEKPSSVVSNLNRTGLMKNPWYNKKMSQTSHGDFLDEEALYKLGQITLDDYKDHKIKLSETLTPIKEQNNIQKISHETPKNVFHFRSHSHSTRNAPQLLQIANTNKIQDISQLGSSLIQTSFTKPLKEIKNSITLKSSPKQVNKTFQAEDNIPFKKSFLEQVHEQRMFEQERQLKEEQQRLREERELERVRQLFNNQNIMMEHLADFYQNDHEVVETKNQNLQKKARRTTRVRDSQKNIEKLIDKEGENIEQNQQNYYFKRLRPWQIYLKQKVKQLVKIERKYKPEEIKKEAEENYYLQKLLKFREKEDYKFLENPVDECMQTQFFKKDDLLMKFYEKKYRIEMKEVRPFGNHAKIKELNPLYNEEVYTSEMKKFQKEQDLIKRKQKKRFFEMSKDFNKTSFCQPLKREARHQSLINQNLDQSVISDYTFNPITSKNQSMLADYRNKSPIIKNKFSLNLDIPQIQDISQPLYSVNSRNTNPLMKNQFTFHQTTRNSISNIFPNMTFDHKSSLRTQIAFLAQTVISDKIEDYHSTHQNMNKTFNKMKTIISKKNFKKSVIEKRNDLINMPVSGLDQLSIQIDSNIDLGTDISQAGLKQLQDTSRLWHVNGIKSLNTAEQLQELRINRFKKY
eukprot:403363767